MSHPLQIALGWLAKDLIHRLSNKILTRAAQVLCRNQVLHQENAILAPQGRRLGKIIELGSVALFALAERLLGEFAVGDIADIALDHAFVLDGIDVADKFHIHASSITRFERQVLVPDIPLVLQFRKGCFGSSGISKKADLPEFLSN